MFLKTMQTREDGKMKKKKKKKRERRERERESIVDSLVLAQCA